MRDSFKRELAAMPKDMQKQVKDALKKHKKDFDCNRNIKSTGIKCMPIDVATINKRNEGCF